MTITSSVQMKAPNTLIMISAADVITRAVEPEALDDAAVAVAGLLVLLTDRG